MGNFDPHFDPEDDDQYSRDNIICPHCGWLHTTDETYEDTEQECENPDCEKPFSVEVYMSYSYTTRRITTPAGSGEGATDGR